MGFAVQFLGTAAAIAFGIRLNSPPWLHVASLAVPFLLGAVFVLSYDYARPMTRVGLAFLYTAFSSLSLMGLSLLLFCSMLTCS